jgi:hypothetical protein
MSLIPEKGATVLNFYSKPRLHSFRNNDHVPYSGKKRATVLKFYSKTRLHSFRNNDHVPYSENASVCTEIL